jgi:membrane protease YdiL (CAAX protease family)
VGSRARSLRSALGWAAAVTATEAIARRSIPSRSRAWLVSYSALGAAASVTLLARPRALPTGTERRGKGRARLVAGLVLSGIGYQLGRKALGDRPTDPPSEPAWLEMAALAGVVAPVEEVVWGALVQPGAGVVATSALFAAKHPLIDGRWRRTLGLGLFGLGLGLLRRRSGKLALLVHVGCNAGGVALGHLTGRDQF